MKTTLARARPRLPHVAAAALALSLLLGAGPAFPAEGLPYGQGLLWRIERAGGDPSYLFGTIHITDKRAIDLPAPVRDAFDSARSVTLEVIMDDELRGKLARAMILNGGRTLDAILGPELFADTVAAGRRYGIGPDRLRYLKPWALATILSVPQSELARTAAGNLPLDQWLQAEADRRGKPLHSLELGDEQIALFDGMAEDDQIALLKSAVAGNAEIETVFGEMVRLYLEREVGEIYQNMQSRAGHENPELASLFMRRFNQARNILMVERMAERLREGGAFIAVGALHLPGEDGLLRLLERRGYGISRLY